MPKTLQYLSVCYRALLWLYPSDLRDAYGKEMANVFEQLLWKEWTRRGARGVASAGCRAIGELFTVAIPRQLVSDRMIAAGLSLVITSGILALLVGMMMWPRYRFR
jgi:hypothetical protein